MITEMFAWKQVSTHYRTVRGADDLKLWNYLLDAALRISIDSVTSRPQWLAAATKLQNYLFSFPLHEVWGAASPSSSCVRSCCHACTTCPCVWNSALHCSRTKPASTLNNQKTNYQPKIHMFYSKPYLHL